MSVRHRPIAMCQLEKPAEMPEKGHKKDGKLAEGPRKALGKLSISIIIIISN